jgi:hypothetical protein
VPPLTFLRAGTQRLIRLLLVGLNRLDFPPLTLIYDPGRNVFLNVETFGYHLSSQRATPTAQAEHLRILDEWPFW